MSIKFTSDLYAVFSLNDLSQWASCQPSLTIVQSILALSNEDEKFDSL